MKQVLLPSPSKNTLNGPDRGISSKYMVSFTGEDKWLFKVGSYEGRNEVLAYEMAKLLGLSFVPETFYAKVEIDGVVLEGSCQRWIDTFRSGWLSGTDSLSSAIKQHAEAFDYLIAQEDRHDNNWGVDEQGKLWLIDNAFAFGEYRGQAFNFFICQSDQIRADHSYVAKRAQKVKPLLLTLLREAGKSESQVDAFGERLDKLSKVCNDYQEKERDLYFKPRPAKEVYERLLGRGTCVK